MYQQPCFVPTSLMLLNTAAALEEGNKSGLQVQATVLKVMQNDAGAVPAYWPADAARGRQNSGVHKAGL